MAFDLAAFPPTRTHGAKLYHGAGSTQLVALSTHGKIPGTELPAPCNLGPVKVAAGGVGLLRKAVRRADRWALEVRL